VSGESTFSQLTAARLVSALLAALAAALALLTVREIASRHESLAVAAGLLVAFQPEFGFMGGVVNNDSGVNAAAALLLFLLVRGCAEA
jgi:4-amino-4-deoxy-L-arabinose transferase-like glycosyltransferase